MRFGLFEFYRIESHHRVVIKPMTFGRISSRYYDPHVGMRFQGEWEHGYKYKKDGQHSDNLKNKLQSNYKNIVCNRMSRDIFIESSFATVRSETGNFAKVHRWWNLRLVGKKSLNNFEKSIRKSSAHSENVLRCSNKNVVVLFNSNYRIYFTFLRLWRFSLDRGSPHAYYYSLRKIYGREAVHFGTNDLVRTIRHHRG